jgi:hypothetical protein
MVNTHRKFGALLACVLTTFPANLGLASVYWCFLTTAATEERPLIGQCELSFDRNGAVSGDLFLDIPYPNKYNWRVEGKNSTSGVLGFRLTSAGAGSQRAAEGSSLNETLLSGILRKTIRGRQIIWDGEVKPVNSDEFDRAIRSLHPVSKAYRLRLITFSEMQGDTFGFQHTEGTATWSPARDNEARAWLKRNGVLLNGGKSDPPGSWSIDLPPFSQSLTVYRMLASGIFDQVIRTPTEKGGGEAYFVTCAQQSVFSHPPDTREGTAESLAFTRRFLTDLVATPKYRQLQIEGPSVVRPHRYHITITGPSQDLGRGPKGYWDRYELDFSFYKNFGDGPGEMSLEITVMDSYRAKGPADNQPPAERFEYLSESSEKLLAAFGTILGERVNARQQGLTLE